MNAISRRLIGAVLVAGGLLAALPVSAQQFTMKLSMPTINDVTYEYFKRMKAGIEQRLLVCLDLFGWSRAQRLGQHCGSNEKEHTSLKRKRRGTLTSLKRKRRGPAIATASLRLRFRLV